MTAFQISSAAEDTLPIRKGISWVYGYYSASQVPGYTNGISVSIRVAIDSVRYENDIGTIFTTESFSGLRGTCPISNPVGDDTACFAFDTLWHPAYRLSGDTMALLPGDTLALTYVPYNAILPTILPPAIMRNDSLFTRHLDGAAYFISGMNVYHHTIGFLGGYYIIIAGSAATSSSGFAISSYCDSVINVAELKVRLSQVVATTRPSISKRFLQPRTITSYHDLLGRNIRLRNLQPQTPAVVIRSIRGSRNEPRIFVR